MKIQPSPHSIILGSVLLCLLSFTTAQSQQIVVVSSSVSYNATTNIVSGTTRTEMDYYTGLYYQAYAEGYLYAQGNGNPISSGTNASIPGVNLAAVVATQATASPYTTYSLNGNHLIGTLYRDQSWNGVICGNVYPWNDVYGYVWNGYVNYGASATIFATYRTACLSTPYINFGTTTTSLKTPPTLSITNSFVSGNLKGTTQNALLASPAGLQAVVTPAGVPGNYVWSFTGPFVVDFTSQDNSYRSVYWTQPGSYVATVTYSGSGFSLSANVTVQIKVPTLTSFNGNSAGNILDRGSNCGRVFSGAFLPYGATFSLGCSQNNANGMLWSATATIPNVSYLSDLGDAGIEFKQIVSVYRKRMNNGRLECFTARNPQSDPSTGWQIDFANPYFTDEYVIPSFQMGKTITAQEFDSPTRSLDGRGNLDGSPFRFDAVSIDDRFETYVAYYTGSPRSPSFQVLLHVADSGCPADRFDCGIDRLAWTWGGNASFNSSAGPILYSQFGSTTTIGTVPRVRGTLARSYTGVAQQNNAAALCAGAPDTHNPIDGSRFFVEQMYWGFLDRGPDASGWDFWTSQITQCNVDTLCIYGNNQTLFGKRFDVANAFFYSGETIAKYPGLANPPGSPGFDPNVYNPAFVTALYNGVLDRAPDPGGLQFWVGQLNQYGNYGPLLNAFLTCGEFRQRFGAADPHY